MDGVFNIIFNIIMNPLGLLAWWYWLGTLQCTPPQDGNKGGLV